MWPFSLIKKKRIEREQQAQLEKQLEVEALQHQKAEQKRIFIERKNYIDGIVQSNFEQQLDFEEKQIEIETARNEKHNSTCPNCGSRNVCKVYNRLQGSLDGGINSHSSSYSSFGLFSGSSSHYNHTHGSIRGEMDTIRVNKCNDCNHEWEYKKENFSSLSWYPGKIDYSMDVPRFLDKVYYLLEDSRKFDPDALTETCSTLEEWIKKNVEQIRDFYKDIQSLELEVLYYYARRHSYNVVHEEEIFGFNWRNSGDSEIERYISSFTPEIENILIEWFGFKKHFA